MATVRNSLDKILQAAPYRTLNAPNAAVLLMASAPAFHVNAAGANDPASITFTASLIALEGTIAFAATGGTLTIAGNVATLIDANMPGATASVTASVTANGQTFTSNVCAVSKLQDGSNGYSNVRVFAYQRAASAPTGTPGAIDVDLTTGTITTATLANGWLKTIPAANGNPLYVTAASASAAGTTDTIASGEWSGAVVLAQDGTPGSPGSPGAAGLNSATVTIYQRSATATAPALPSASTTYTFATGVLTGLNNGWSQYIPSTGGAYLHTSLATAAATTPTDAIAAGEWAAVTLMYDAAALIQAQADATAAKDALTAIFADNVLSRDEKTEVIRRVGEKDGEYTGIVNQASALSVASSAYVAANTAVNVYLTGLSPAWSDTSQNTPIVRIDANTAWNNYYAAKVALLNAIAAKAAFAPSLVIGGRNLYSKTQLLASISGASYVEATRPASGFTLVGVPAATGVMRMYNVIPANGTYTVSFDVVTSQSGAYPMYIDVCDGATQTINPATTAQHFSLTFTVANWSSSTYNFIDFGGLVFQQYSFTNFKVEAGNKETGWGPSPEDITADAQAKADAAQAAAISTAAIAAQAKADLARTTAEAYADGIVTAEEARAIADATAKANAAQTAAQAAAAADATAKANAAALTAQWPNIGGTGKPADGATVGAPTGTNVAGVPAETVAGNAAAGAAASTTLNNPPALNSISDVSASVYKPAVTIATIFPSVTAGVAPFRFDWSMLRVTSGDAGITYTVSTVSQPNDKLVIKGICLISGGTETVDVVTCTATDSKGRTSTTQFNVSVSG